MSSLVSLVPNVCTTRGSCSISSLKSGIANQRLWKGVISVIMGAGPAHAFYFATYEESRRTLDTFLPPSVPLVVKTGVCGSLATMASDALMNPFDVIKQRMQALSVSTSASTSTSFLSTALGIVRNEGILSLYVSYPVTLALNIPFQAIQFSVYEQIHDIFNPTHQYSPKSHVIAGAVAGAAASAVTTPLDVIKTILQTRTLVARNPSEAPIAGIIDAVGRVWRSAGPAGFIKGIVPRILVHMPSTAICWTTYEYFKYFL
ncbi:Fe(2+) transporter [Mitosporidium daphniae]